MSVFEERAPLLKAAEKKMRNNNNNSNDEFSVLNNEEDETLMLSSKKKNKKSGGGSSKRPGEWRTKSVMIGTTALIFGAALVSTTRTNEDGMNIMSKGESDAGNNNIEGNLGATEEAKSSASKSSASASNLKRTYRASAASGLLIAAMSVSSSAFAHTCTSAVR